MLSAWIIWIIVHVLLFSEFVSIILGTVAWCTVLVGIVLLGNALTICGSSLWEYFTSDCCECHHSKPTILRIVHSEYFLHGSGVGRRKSSLVDRLCWSKWRWRAQRNAAWTESWYCWSSSSLVFLNAPSGIVAITSIITYCKFVVVSMWFIALCSHFTFYRC